LLLPLCGRTAQSARDQAFLPRWIPPYLSRGVIGVRVGRIPQREGHLVDEAEVMWVSPDYLTFVK
jgi:hypothetical protein